MSFKQSLNTTCILHSDCVHLENAHNVLENALTHLENDKRVPMAIINDIQVVRKAMLVIQKGSGYNCQDPSCPQEIRK
jgi:hypothetical protein